MTPRAIAEAAARAAGNIQRDRLNTAFAVSHKGAVDLVTEVDLACEDAIRKLLGELAPGDSILGEEEGLSGKSSRLWIVDPLDGTTNYAHRVPAFCCSVAFEEDGVLKAGAIYEPLRDEMFSAALGEGATLNGAKISVSAQNELGESLMATGFPYDYRTTGRHIFEAFTKLTRASMGVRRLGAAALDLAYVAAGRFDGFWEVGLKPWDTSAGTLLIREAGGTVTNFDGAPYDNHTPDIVASNSLIHGKMIAELSPYLCS